MNPKWIEYCWEQRFDINFDASDPQVIEKFRLKPFDYLSLTFVGFPPEDLEKMEQLTEFNGGKVVSMDDPKCTHIVVYAISGENDPELMLNPANENVKVVYEEVSFSFLDNLIVIVIICFLFKFSGFGLQFKFD